MEALKMFRVSYYNIHNNKGLHFIYCNYDKKSIIT